MGKLKIARFVIFSKNNHRTKIILIKSELNFVKYAAYVQLINHKCCFFHIHECPRDHVDPKDPTLVVK